jgi:streptogramin lyase
VLAIDQRQQARPDAPGGSITEFALPHPDSTPALIALGPDGDLWFTERERSANRIGRMNARGTIVAEYTLPTPGSRPAGIVACRTMFCSTTPAPPRLAAAQPHGC